ncbi:MAG: PEP-CTERM/exosortase system-associated acyltransferase [Acidobacteriota bacterium]
MFDRHFEAFLADNEPGRQTHYRLRYQVYCRDTGWEDDSRFPDQMERDENDAFSVPFLVRRRRSKGWIATMRLIRKPLEELPISCFTRLQPGRLPSSARDRTIEFSRLCVVKKYRRPPQHRISGEMAEQQQPPADFDDSFLASGYRNSESWIFMGLVRAGWQWSVQNDVAYWLFFIADALARIIRRSGFAIEPVGNEVEHRGLRRPYLFEIHPGKFPVDGSVPEIHEMFMVSPAYRAFSDLHVQSQGVRRGPR